MIKRKLLHSFYGYKLDPTARIGFSWVYPSFLEMGPHASIGHLNVIVNLDTVRLGSHATLSRQNWVTGFPTQSASRHFSHEQDRRAELTIGNHSAITKCHHIDCTNVIQIGSFVTIAGYRSQLLTHSIDLVTNQQSSKPITIEDYCFIGTDVVVLGGATLPKYSVLGAKSLLNKSFTESYTLYAGVPAKPIQKISPDAKYFQRTVGFVD